ncbi:ornithine carbamoyltransferase [Desulfitispora alkaliphila]|uniref:ornithine carbamoyltransferase n=1 Tax=Desulfitispora alkaliphila TaxID=622674 RepID=UPI003D223A23
MQENINLKGKDFLSLKDYSKGEINYLLSFAANLKDKQKRGEKHNLLQGKSLGMIFEKPSTRTRMSFEVGIYQLGGQALFLSSRDLQIGRGEPICDTARVFSRYVDGIMIRTFSHADVEELAHYATIPVINGLTDLLHPCQVLADLLTIKEYKGKLEGQKLVYIGDGNNMAHSLMYGGAKMGMNVVIAAPEAYFPDEKITAEAKSIAAENGGTIELISNPKEAAEDADVLYTDVWASMGQESEQEERMEKFLTYQVNNELMACAKKDAIVLHCLPAHRGEEITAEVLEKYQNVIFDEAENRLHAQKAIMAAIM